MPGRWSPRRLDRVAGTSTVRIHSIRLAAAFLAAALLVGCGGGSDKSAPTVTSIRQFTIVTPTPKRTTSGAKKTPAPTTYIVQPGDTLSLIATRFHVSEDDLQTLNHLPDPDSLYSGEQLLIPQPTN